MRMTDWERERKRLAIDERSFFRSAAKKKPSALADFVQDKIPEKLQSTLESAFARSFEIVFERGVRMIEKTYDRQKISRQYRYDLSQLSEGGERRELRRFLNRSNATSSKNAALSGVKGVGLGLLGVGLADIPLFIGMMLRGVYEICLEYGYTYEQPQERSFILSIIEASLQSGDDFLRENTRIDEFIERGGISYDIGQRERIASVSKALASEVLAMKFIQGIPLVGAVGGLYDAVFTHRVLRYAKLKYRRRFLHDHAAER